MTVSAKKLSKISRYLSFVLRHRPEAIGVAMDRNGWVDIAELIDKTPKYPLTRALIRQIVETDDKQRYAFSQDHKRIRANQGHSVDIDLKLQAMSPPARLYHGTAHRFWQPISREGLRPMQRQHVHLSESADTALSVGTRYGTPLLLEIDIPAMQALGLAFYRSANGVWLVDRVPPDCLLRDCKETPV